MKILFINDVYTVGGATKALCEIVTALKEKGITPVVCTSVKDDFNTFLDENGIENIADNHFSVMDSAPKRSLKRPLQYGKRFLKYILSRDRAVKNIERQIDMRSVDIIHTNSARNDIGCILHEKYGIPHVMHLREFGKEDFSCWVFRTDYYRYMSRQSSVILAVSDTVKRSWTARGVFPEKTYKLYDGVDFRNFKVKNDYSCSEKKLRLVFVGGICETKGQHIAVKALGKIPKDIRKNITLDLIGWHYPDTFKYINDLIEEFDLMNNVRLLGSRNDVNELLENYDVGLMCSKSEGFGRVTAEYMYSGLAVIAADTGASPELITDGFTGLIYSRNDENDLAEKIMMLYKDRSLLKKFGTAAHAESERRFSIEKNINTLIKIYDKLYDRSKGDKE